MSNYIEDSNSVLFHVLYEFETFLSAVCIYHKYDVVGIKNIALDSIYLHVRSLSDFFSNSKSGKAHSDDIIYSRFISCHINDVVLTDNVREYINKGVAHITSSRRRLALDNDALYNSVKEILLAIKAFMENLNIYICHDYSDELKDADVVKIQKSIDKLLLSAACYLASPT